MSESIKDSISKLKRVKSECLDYTILGKINESDLPKGKKEDERFFLIYKVSLKVSREKSKYSCLVIYNSNYDKNICFCSKYKTTNDVLIIYSNGHVYLGNVLLEKTELIFQEMILKMEIRIDFELQKIVIKAGPTDIKYKLTYEFPIPKSYQKCNENNFLNKLNEYSKNVTDSTTMCKELYKEYFPFTIAASACDLIPDEDEVEDEEDDFKGELYVKFNQCD